MSVCIEDDEDIDNVLILTKVLLLLWCLVWSELDIADANIRIKVVQEVPSSTSTPDEVYQPGNMEKKLL